MQGERNSLERKRCSHISASIKFVHTFICNKDYAHNICFKHFILDLGEREVCICGGPS